MWVITSNALSNTQNKVLIMFPLFASINSPIPANHSFSGVKKGVYFYPR